MATTGLALITLWMMPRPAAADQVILDDLIVDGSACIGQDCVNGESFGFDTIRIKENNLRIKAQDTSNSASFPTNDWQLTFNDSSNGGANKFSIDDIDGGRTPFTIEAGARTNALYVESDGDVGFGTNNPVTNLHAVDGNTPTLRLEQDGSSGFTPQTWDVAGNEANFFVRDATNGSRLVFRIQPGAPGNALFIASSGNVGIGTSSPGAKLHVEGDVTLGSSREIKESLGPVDSRRLLDLLSELPIHTWRYLDESEDVRHIGPMAEDFHRTFGLSSNPRQLSIVDVNGLSLAAAQELYRQLLAKEQDISELKRRLASLEEVLEQSNTAGFAAETSRASRFPR